MLRSSTDFSRYSGTLHYLPVEGELLGWPPRQDLRAGSSAKTHRGDAKFVRFLWLGTPGIELIVDGRKPTNIKTSQEDFARAYLVGMKVPRVLLCATDGTSVDLRGPGLSVVYGKRLFLKLHFDNAISACPTCTMPITHDRL
ncbi:hypothetical protein AGR8A_pTi10103 [Agrobacterium fabrum str. J-07]|nr:hypothetical protein AGR8A_pTi10103 [Agrobacterium fabrum str. J-07]